MSERTKSDGYFRFSASAPANQDGFIRMSSQDSRETEPGGKQWRLFRSSITYFTARRRCYNRRMERDPTVFSLTSSGTYLLRFSYTFHWMTWDGCTAGLREVHCYTNFDVRDVHSGHLRYTAATATTVVQDRRSTSSRTHYGQDGERRRKGRSTFFFLT